MRRDRRTASLGHVGHLLRDQASEALKGSVYLLPGTVHYGSPILAPDQVATDRVLDVIHRLDEIAQVVETIQPPEVAGQMSRFEKFAKVVPWRRRC